MTSSNQELSEFAPGAMHSDLDGSKTSEEEPLLASLPDKDPYSSIRFSTRSLLWPWFPEIEPDDPRSQSWLRKFSDRDVALLVLLSVATAVLIFNASVTAYVLHKYSFSSNISNLLGNDGTTCNQVKRYNMWLHFAINALSTILLGSSNYCAQLLVAPTREDVNKAHRGKRWFDIGVQSWSNLFKIDKTRRILWFSLMVSSGLLHLLWNSAIFIAVPVSQNNVALITSDFGPDDPWDGSSYELMRLRQNAAHGHGEHLTPEDCIEQYAGQKAGLLDVLLVSSNITTHNNLSFATNSSSSLLQNFTVGGGVDWAIAGSWMCSARAKPGEITKTFCTKESLLPNAANWTFFGTHFNLPKEQDLDKVFWSKIDHCISAGKPRSMEDKCALRVSSAILGIVCILNAAKCVCIFYTTRLHFKNQRATKDAKSQLVSLYLVTIGDAVASFLETPDKETRSLQVVERSNFSQDRWPDCRYSAQLKEYRWFKAATLRRWLVTVFLCIAMLAIVSMLLSMTIQSQKDHGISTDISSLWRYGLGEAQLWATALTTLMRKMNFTTGFFFATFFANSFQVVVSALYFLYNNLITVMLVSAEWNNFISERKTLRVSAPYGIQRSNYFLSLPYRYSITLMVFSLVLHWMISQSVFVIQTIGYKAPNFDPDSTLDASVIGYSSIGIIFSMAAGSVLMVGLLIISRFKYKPKKLKEPKEPKGLKKLMKKLMKLKKPKKPKQVRPWQDDASYPMPLVSTCSAAISAACHKHIDDVDVHLLPVRWGYITDVAGEEPGKGKGRFRFTTARTVHYPSTQDVCN